MDLKKLQPIMDAYKQVQEKAKMDPVDSKELKGKLSDRKDKDINNDGKVDDTDSYLHNRRKTIKKAMKKDDQSETETQVSEESMTDAQMKKREKYVLAMKDKMPEFKKKYGDRAKEVMYATATKMAMKEEAELDEASIYSQLAKMAGTPKNPDKGSALAHLAKSKKVQDTFKKVKKEEVEQIDELSPNTLKSYSDKANKSLDRLAKQRDAVEKSMSKTTAAIGKRSAAEKAAHRATTQAQHNKATAAYRAADKSAKKNLAGHGDLVKQHSQLTKKINKRMDGMDRAYDKMHEEVELDEASIYSQLAKMAGTPKNPDKGSALAHLAKSQKVQSALKNVKMKKEKVEEIDEISSDLAKRYTKAAKMDRDFNDDDIRRLSKSGQSTRDMHKRNAKRTKGIYRAAKRMEEVEQIEEDITKMSDARLKFHAVKKFPHGSYTRKEVDDEHKRRLKTVPNYHTVKPSLNEVRKEEVDHKKGATKPETMDDRMTASDKKFIQPHGTLDGNDSGIDGEKAAQQTVDSIKSSSKGPKTRPNDKNVGDRNAEVPADVTKRAGVKEAKTFEDLMKKLGGLE